MEASRAYSKSFGQPQSRLEAVKVNFCREKGKGNMLSNRPKADLEQLQFNFFITTVDSLIHCISLKLKSQTLPFHKKIR